MYKNSWNDMKSVNVTLTTHSYQSDLGPALNGSGSETQGHQGNGQIYLFWGEEC